MLNLAIITRYFPSSAEPWQGRSCYETLRILATKAHVKVFYPNAAYPSFLKPRTRLYDQLDASFAPPGVNVQYLNYPALPLVSRPLNGPMAARALLPHVRRFAPDIVLGIFLYPEAWAALRIAKTLSVPLVAESIGSDINRIADPLTGRSTRTVLRQASYVITKSHDLRDKAIAMGASPATTRALPNGCDTALFRPQDRRLAREKLHIDPSAEAVVYIGRTDIRKGLRELVDAAAALHSARPRLQVYMVGEGPDGLFVKDHIRRHNADDYIHLMPRCSFDDVATWMSASDLVTLPSYMEGCPNVVLEALACGRPVVATNVGGIPEILSEQFGRLVPARDSAALARALASVLDAQWDAAAIAAQNNRSWNDVAEELLHILELMIPSHRLAQAR
jgi:teichuronic acid biosynthesis glycosyltransferase TuaC